MNNRDKLFVETMVKDGLSPARAYAKNYDTKGLTVSQINSRANAKCRVKEIAEYRLKLQARAATLAEVDATWILLQYKRLYDFNINKFLCPPDSSGIRRYDFSSATEDDWFCIQEYTALDRYSGPDHWVDVKVKTHDKKSLLDAMGRHVSVAAFQKQIEESSSNDLVDALRTLADSLPS